jgi:hypothetical protein
MFITFWTTHGAERESERKDKIHRVGPNFGPILRLS